ncbi:MAG TPA: phosphoadenylyl-sulfate reductase [Thermoplasmata archaeon]|nr:phosphoadenylyl-sulfate reductase [Thermoplasmata archaeon]
MKIEELKRKLSGEEPQKIIEYALNNYKKIAISFSGAEDVALIDMATKIKGDVNIFTLDTGRLHPETYEFLDRVRDHYNINLKTYFPDAHAVEQMVNKKGLFSFYQDGHEECCGIRKVEPLERALSSLDAWVTGQRRDSNPASRASLPVVQKSGRLIKFNPVANWSLKRVWEYIRENRVPYNELHKRGFVSVGCAPCTRPILPGQHEREGRWWWETGERKECGIHLTLADSLSTTRKRK